MGNKKILFKILQNVFFFNKMENIVENHVHIFLISFKIDDQFIIEFIWK